MLIFCDIKKDLGFHLGALLKSLSLLSLGCPNHLGIFSVFESFLTGVIGFVRLFSLAVSKMRFSIEEKIGRKSLVRMKGES